MLLNMKNKNKKSGFTIIELIVVIVVIGILAALIVIAYNGVRRQAIISAITADLNNQQKILEVYKVDHGYYPNIINCPSDETSNTLCIKERNSETNYTYIPDNPNNPQAYFLAAKRSEMIYETALGESPKEFLPKWKQVSSGSSHTCAININEKVYCWGNNSYGQLGRISPSYLINNNSSIPIPINNAGAINKNKIKSISSGDNHTCAIDDKNIAYCWGDNTFGQLGNESDISSPNPVVVSKGDIPSNITFSSISAGGSHTCAVASNKNAYCWGNNSYGQLGLNDILNIEPWFIQIDKSNKPLVVYENSILGYSGDVTNISAGSNHTCVVVGSRAICWGNNNKKQLGIFTSGSNTYRLPYRVHNTWSPFSSSRSYLANSSYNNLDVVLIDAGYEHTCAIVAAGSTDQNMARCWGEASAGQVGDGATTDRNYPVRTSSINNNLTDISLGKYFSCAVNSSGDGYCWGQNDKGQIGQNIINTGYASPKILVTNNIPNGTKFKQIDAGSDFACSTMTDETLYCWGNNLSGQIGIKTTSDSVSLPTKIFDPYY